MGAQDAQVMRDEVLSTLGDPGQVTYAQLPTLAQSSRQHESGGIRERSGSLGSFRSNVCVEPRPTYRVRTRKVETKEITALLVHELILTPVDTLLEEAEGRRTSTLGLWCRTVLG